MVIARSTVVALCLAALSVQAQQALPQLPRELRPDAPVQPAARVPQAAPAQVPDKAEELFVQVGRVDVVDGFSEFAALTEGMTAQVCSKRISVADFYRLAESIEALYREGGFPLVRVTVPPQNLKDGDNLRLIVLDGTIEKLDLAAVPAPALARVQEVLQPLVGQRRLRNGALERALTLAGRGPGLTLRSALSAGASSGGVVLVLEGDFARTSASLSVDNRLSESVGPWQTTVQFTVNEPLGNGNQVYAYVSGGENITKVFQSDAPRRVVGGGVIIPLGANGLSFNPELTWSDTQPPGQPAVPRSQSRMDRLTFRFTYPLILSRDKEVNVTGALEMANQLDVLPEFDTTLDQDKLRMLRVGANWNVSMASQARLSASATLSMGFLGLGARTQADAESSGIALSRLGADPAFRKLEANVVYEHPLPWSVQSKTIFRAQSALGGVLPSTELFSLTGEDALSMFTSGGLSDDNGRTLRQEFSRPFELELGKTTVATQPYVFAAIGKVKSELASAPESGMHSVYGIGLKVSLKMLNLGMEYGQRQSENPARTDSQFFMKAQVQF
jgi:hemolysin activation/secretion protein